ncbi:pentatricopeptide repeat-containing protein At1g12300, mitochondrial-like [Vigna radiata var. radiata]|uniref:Pentatricopeptide repeat-containing protein At1g12300, mitochondrial-like n=1 Tax=Vigna radiata var. radiata TaxID=3916 RepID=A0A3Q0ENW8_VIGRR|nr:pentatricopeptide repeat-containing protein At1g12300, mitochondrial-like [Vigna radiata var. radiata]
MWIRRSVRVSLLPSIAKFPPFLPIHNSLFCTHSHTSLHDEAVSQFNSLLHKRHVPPVFEFGKILGFLVRIKRYPIAISLIKQMELKGIHNDLVNFSLLMNCFCHLDKLAFAFSVFAKILKRGYHPDAITINTLLRGLCDKGEVKEALNLHDKVVALGFPLSQFTYGILINGLCKIGETEAAIKVQSERFKHIISLHNMEMIKLKSKRTRDIPLLVCMKDRGTTSFHSNVIIHNQLIKFLLSYIC